MQVLTDNVRSVAIKQCVYFCIHKEEDPLLKNATSLTVSMQSVHYYPCKIGYVDFIRWCV